MSMDRYPLVVRLRNLTTENWPFSVEKLCSDAADALEQAEEKIALLNRTIETLVKEREKDAEILKEARTELARWGWGDFHYGNQAQEESVVKMLERIDSHLGVESVS